MLIIISSAHSVQCFIYKQYYHHSIPSIPLTTTDQHLTPATHIYLLTHTHLSPYTIPSHTLIHTPPTLHYFPTHTSHITMPSHTHSHTRPTQLYFSTHTHAHTPPTLQYPCANTQHSSHSSLLVACKPTLLATLTYFNTRMNAPSFCFLPGVKQRLFQPIIDFFLWNMLSK